MIDVELIDGRTPIKPAPGRVVGTMQGNRWRRYHPKRKTYEHPEESEHFSQHAINKRGRDLYYALYEKLRDDQN